MKLSLHISPTRVDYSTAEGSISGRASEDLDAIAEHLQRLGGVDASVLEAPVGAALDSHFWLVFDDDLEWHLQSVAAAATRFVILHPSRDRAFQLLEELDAAALVGYERARAWAEPATGGLVVRRDIAGRLGGELGVGLPFFKQTRRHASWKHEAYPTLAEQLVAYLRELARTGATR